MISRGRKYSLRVALVLAMVALPIAVAGLLGSSRTADVITFAEEFVAHVDADGEDFVVVGAGFFQTR
jgi:hypothetical protein